MNISYDVKVSRYQRSLEYVTRYIALLTIFDYFGSSIKDGGNVRFVPRYNIPLLTKKIKKKI